MELKFVIFLFIELLPLIQCCRHSAAPESSPISVSTVHIKKKKTEYLTAAKSCGTIANYFMVSSDIEIFTIQDHSQFLKRQYYSDVAAISYHFRYIALQNR